MTNPSTTLADPVPATAVAPVEESIRWLRRHLAWERTMRDCVERRLDAQLGPADPAPDAQSTDGTSAHSRSSS